MVKKILREFKFVFITLLVFVVGCSRDLDSMSILEQSINQPKRFAGDHDQDEYRLPLSILEFSGVKQGDTVIDLLGGGGYYTELLNYVVGDNGKVFIQNNTLFLKFSGDELTKRLSKGRLKNVVRIDSEFANMQLPKNVDLIFIVLSYHDIYVQRENPRDHSNSKEFLSQVSLSLKDGGKLVVLDHAARPGSGLSSTQKLHRIDEEWIKSEIEKYGFELVSSLDTLRNLDDNYDLDIWKKEVFHKTDRFVHLYMKK